MALQLLKEALKDCSPKTQCETYQLLSQSEPRLYGGASQKFIEDLAFKIEARTAVGTGLGLDIISLLLMPDTSRDSMLQTIKSVALRLSKV